VVDAFTQHGLPVAVTGGTKLYSQPEIRLLTNFLTCITSPADSVALYSLVTHRGLIDDAVSLTACRLQITSPVYNFPGEALTRLLESGRKQNTPLRSLLRSLADQNSNMTAVASGGLSSPMGSTIQPGSVFQGWKDRTAAPDGGVVPAATAATVADAIQAVSLPETARLVLSDLANYEQLAARTGIRDVLIRFLEDKQLLALLGLPAAPSSASAAAAASSSSAAAAAGIPLQLSDEHALLREEGAKNVAR